MRVAVIQPNYLPWRGYFDIIDAVDLFVYYDDVQYTKNDWRNRNRLKCPVGTEWITVPVRQTSLALKISEARIDNARGWARRHVNQITANYARAPYFDTYATELFALLQSGFELIAELDIALTAWLMRCLNVGTPTLRASQLSCSGERSERLLSLLKGLGATSYLSGPSARAYIVPEQFKDAGIALAYMRYDYAPYPQLWGEFSGNVTVLDLLMNTGPLARSHLKSCLAPELVA